MKLPGRNEKCWCDSGKKYKHCHLNAEREAPIEHHKVIQALASFKNKKQCSAPDSLLHDCSNKIIKAHSVSKSSSLKAIAENGHVLKYSVKSDTNTQPNITMKKVGINNASTFSGFCSTHDKKLFSPIEDTPFKPIPQHCFLVSYRGLCRELFSKDFASKTFEMMKTLDRGKTLTEQKIIQSVSSTLGGSNDLTTNDLNYIKTKLDKMLTSEDYSGLNFAVFTLASPPPIMGSAIVGPPFDFNGDEIQKISKNPNNIPDYIAINLFSSDNKGYIVLSWLTEHSKTCKKLIKQFIEKNLSSESLATFALILIENIYISPTWWSSLDKSARIVINDLHSQGISTITYSKSIRNKVNLNFPPITDIFISPN